MHLQRYGFFRISACIVLASFDTNFPFVRRMITDHFDVFLQVTTIVVSLPMMQLFIGECTTARLSFLRTDEKIGRIAY